jgi:ribosomal protein S9
MGKAKAVLATQSCGISKRDANMKAALTKKGLMLRKSRPKHHTKNVRDV